MPPQNSTEKKIHQNTEPPSALRRLVEFEVHFKRSAARPEKIGDAWGIKGKAYASYLG
jgi:hypothetical protein